MEDRKVLLSVKDLIVKFHVRGRVLTAIRGVSLDIYENESIAIVGESGSGKSVFTKTFAGMLDSNGFIDNGKIIFSDEELSDTVVKLNDNAKKVIAENKKKLDEYSRLEFGADTYKLKFGHRGSNQPVKNLLTGRVQISSQNHGFAVDEESLKDLPLEVTHINVNDGTVEGIRHTEMPIFSVQYHPEASPGPDDNMYLFDEFWTMLKGE